MAVLSNVLEPPTEDAIGKALSVLTELDALDCTNGKEELTPLGYHLAALPTDVRLVRKDPRSPHESLQFCRFPAILDALIAASWVCFQGKLMVYGAMLGCVDPALTIGEKKIWPVNPSRQRSIFRSIDRLFFVLFPLFFVPLFGPLFDLFCGVRTDNTVVLPSAAALGCRSPFIAPFDKRREVSAPQPMR